MRSTTRIHDSTVEYRSRKVFETEFIYCLFDIYGDDGGQKIHTYLYTSRQ